MLCSASCHHLHVQRDMLCILHSQSKAGLVLVRVRPLSCLLRSVDLAIRSRWVLFHGIGTDFRDEDRTVDMFPKPKFEMMVQESQAKDFIVCIIA